MDWFLYDNGHERVKDFFSKYDQIPWKQRIWSHLLNISLMENLIFCVVNNSFFSFLQYCKETRKTVFLYYLFFLFRSSMTKDVNELAPTRSRSSPPEVQENTHVKVGFHCKVIEIALWYGRSPVNLPHIFRYFPLSKNTFWGLLL